MKNNHIDFNKLSYFYTDLYRDIYKNSLDEFNNLIEESTI